ncbi:MAG: hydroxyphenylacetyl-CoA thioesterase PaaI [Burkholderiales bacterium]
MAIRQVTANTSMDDEAARAQSLADEVSKALYANDAAIRALGITVDSIGPGRARLVMQVRADMINGAGIAHGGIITTLADAAFAFACNSYNKVTLASGITVDFLTPAKRDDILTATATEVSRSGRSGIYDVVVANQHGQPVAVLRGRCRQMRERCIVG